MMKLAILAAFLPLVALQNTPVPGAVDVLVPPITHVVFAEKTMASIQAHEAKDGDLQVGQHCKDPAAYKEGAAACQAAEDMPEQQEKADKFYQHAMQVYLKAARAHEQQGELLIAGYLYQSLGALCMGHEATKEAAQAHVQSIRLYDQAARQCAARKDHLHAGMAYEALARVYTAQGKAAVYAIRAEEQAAKAYAEGGHYMMASHSFEGLAYRYLTLGRLAAANEASGMAVSAYESLAKQNGACGVQIKEIQARASLAKLHAILEKQTVESEASNIQA